MEVFTAMKMTRGGVGKKSVEALELVKITRPEQRMRYPHQLSGGMAGVMIAVTVLPPAAADRR